MEYYFKHPRWQLRPHDDTNYVTAIFKVTQPHTVHTWLTEPLTLSLPPSPTVCAGVHVSPWLPLSLPH